MSQTFALRAIGKHIVGVPEDVTTRGGLMLPQMANKTVIVPTRITSVGPDVAVKVKVGDIVITTMAGQVTLRDGQSWLVAHENAITSVLEPEVATTALFASA